MDKTKLRQRKEAKQIRKVLYPALIDMKEAHGFICDSMKRCKGIKPKNDLCGCTGCPLAIDKHDKEGKSLCTRLADIIGGDEKIETAGVLA